MAQNKKDNKKKTSNGAPKWNSTETVKEKASEMFLMLKQELSVKDIFAAMQEAGMSGMDVWESMGVFAIDLKNESVDFEELDMKETFVDHSDLSFLKNRGIQTVFSFLATESQIEALKPYFKKMDEIFGGFVCSDSDDFQPMVEL